MDLATAIRGLIEENRTLRQERDNANARAEDMAGELDTVRSATGLARRLIPMELTSLSRVVELLLPENHV